MTSEKEHILRKVAYLYYIEDKNQSLIAKDLKVHRTTVSRMLKEAREKGIVEVKIKDFNEELFVLERNAIKKFDLVHLEVVPSKIKNEGNDINDLIGHRAANYIHHIIESGDTIGLSWGASLAKTVRHMEQKFTKDTVFVPLVGGSTEINPSDHVNTLVYELSNNFQGRSLFVNASAVQEAPELAKGITNSKYFLKLRSYWDNLDLAIVGIGGELGIEDSSWRYLLTKNDREMLKDNKIIGDCCCQFFDKDGNILQGDLYDRTIGISLEQLKKTPISIGVAAGDDKVKAITALLENKYINSLVTDEDTLKKVLSYVNVT